MARAGAAALVRGLKAHYRSGINELGAEFFDPCLRECCRYSRAAGYFSSSALSTWANALPRFGDLDGCRIRLLVSPVLSPQDKEALRAAIAAERQAGLREEIADRFAGACFEFARAPEQLELRLRLLTYLVATGRLELRFAFPVHVDQPGIFHEKLGIFEFPSPMGDTPDAVPEAKLVAFTGSANESLPGHRDNYESIDVYRGWKAEDRERVSAKVAQFEQAWCGDAPGLRVVGLTRKTLSLVRSRARAPAEHPSDDGPMEVREPLSPAYGGKWRHQDEAIEAFLAARRGVLEMATGTGKTRTSLRICTRLEEEDRIDSLIVTADGLDLLDQWYSELLELRATSLSSWLVHRHFGSHRRREAFAETPTRSALVISRPQLAPVLSAMPARQAERTLLVHDEVHRLGSPGNRGQLAGLSESIGFMLGLSATPEREYDEEGSRFIEEHVGPVIYRFGLASAIRRGVLAAFRYFPVEYEPDAQDRSGIRDVYKLAAAKKAKGEPLSQEQIWTRLARVHKTSRAKLQPFRDFIAGAPELLRRCIVFVETTEYGQEVLEILHEHRHDFRTYFSGENKDTLTDFVRERLECLVTCHRLSEGIDIRSLQTVILFSSARARLETIQRIGRCLRTNPSAPGKRANVVDLVRVATEDAAFPNTDQQRKAWLAELAKVTPEQEP